MRAINKVSALFLAAAMCVGRAGAVELLDVVLLPDAGFGGYAAASFRLEIAGLECIVGEKANSLGRDLPMAWMVDDAGHVVAYNQLPVPNGFEGEALDGCEFLNGDIIVVGNIIDTDGRFRGVLWRKTPLGPWSAPKQLFPTATESRMARADYCGNGTALMGTTASVLSNNLWSPVAVFVNAAGTCTFRALPMGMGTEGEALCVDGADAPGEFTFVGGNIVTNVPDVTVIPNFWTGNTSGFTSHTLPHMDGFMGSVVDVRVRGSQSLLCGGFRNIGGESHGFWSTGVGVKTVNELAGFDYAHIDSFWLGSNDALGAALMLGTSWNGSGPNVATLWDDDWLAPCAARMILSDPSSVSELRRMRADGDEVVTVGEVVPNGGQLGRAAAFLTTDTHGPDTMSVLVGKYYGQNHVSNLWHVDGQYNRVTTSLVNNVQTARCVLGFNPMNRRNWTSGAVHIVARTLGTGVTGTLKIYQRNESNLGYTLFKTVTVGNAAMTIDAPLPSPMSNWFNATTGAMHTQILYTGHAGLGQSLVLETVTMTCE